ncbi:MAG: NADH:ubiquinone reductase (Na(+)-transporting) subunit D [Bacteroidales bacterium]|nr:NADH:ubiquinone reductase (Na(+)-transporting) subunit D [Bacteroidales bacterium]
MDNKTLKIFTDPIYKNNPITVQVLGVCSALAVTVKLQPAVVMALSLIFVTVLSNVIISLIRNFIPQRIRIIVQLLIVAALVIIIDLILKAFAFNISKELSVFVGLIITNCIIMGRIEAFALSNKVSHVFLDSLGNGIGYGLILVIISFFREIIGSGTIWNFQVVPEKLYEFGYINNSLMILPPMTLIIIGVIISIQKYKSERQVK